MQYLERSQRHRPNEPVITVRVQRVSCGSRNGDKRKEKRPTRRTTPNPEPWTTIGCLRAQLSVWRAGPGSRGIKCGGMLTRGCSHARTSIRKCTGNAAHSGGRLSKLPGFLQGPHSLCYSGITRGSWTKSGTWACRSDSRLDR